MCSFIDSYLINRIGFRINIDNLELNQNDTVDSFLSEFLSDLIYHTENSIDKTPIYLIFEHKCFHDPNIGLQLENYVHMIKDHYEKEHQLKTDLLLIIPVIIYHGVKRWNISSSIPTIRNENIAKYLQCINYEFFDITRLPDKKIIGTAILRIALLTLKYIKKREFLTKIDDILVIFNEISIDTDIKKYLFVFTLYAQSAARPELRQNLISKIVAWVKNGDKNMNKVFEELKKEGKKEVAQKMLSKGMEEKIIHEITGLPLKKISELKKELKI